MKDNILLAHLLKSTNEFRLETKEDVAKFESAITEEARKMDCEVCSFTYTFKSRTVKGEIVDEYYVVKYTLKFDDPKELERPVGFVKYKFADFATEAVPTELIEPFEE